MSGASGIDDARRRNAAASGRKAVNGSRADDDAVAQPVLAARADRHRPVAVSTTTNEPPRARPAPAAGAGHRASISPG